MAISKYINKTTGRYGTSVEMQRRDHLDIDIVLGDIDRQIKREKGREKPKSGKRATFLKNYKVVGYEKAKKIVNKGFEKEVFNDQTLKKWIEEENEK